MDNVLTIHTPFYVATTYHLPTILPPELDKVVDIPDPLGYGLLGGYDHTEHVSGPPQVGAAAELNTPTDTDTDTDKLKM